MVSGIIVAAGKGSRMGASTNKVLLKLGGKEIIEYTIEAFEKCRDIDEIILVISKAEEKLFKDIKKRHNIITTFGGETRTDSVLNGLEAAHGDWAVIHDGARAMIEPELIKKVIDDARKFGAATLGVKAKDTIKIVDSNGIVKNTTDREYTYQTQTPQVFERSFIISAHKKNTSAVTDDATLAELCGKQVKITEGSYENIKITTPEDLILADGILKGRKGQ